MNVTKRQEYCSRNGIAFEMPEFPGPANPITQPPFNTNVAPDAPPPYGAPYPPPMGAPYPPPGAPYPPSGEAYPPLTKRVICHPSIRNKDNGWSLILDQVIT